MVNIISGFVDFWVQGTLDIFRSLSPARWKRAMSSVSWVVVFWLILGAATTIVGCAGQTIALNQWLAVWPYIMYENAPVAGPFSVVVFGAMGLAMIFCALAILSLFQPGALKSVWYVFTGLPNRGSLKAWAALFGASFCCATNTVLMTYGAAGTPILMQAVLMSAQIFLSVIFSMIARVSQGRSYIHLMVFLALAITTGGIVLGLYVNIASVEWTQLTRQFTGVYCAGIIPVPLMGVFIALFFRYALYEEASSPSHVTSGATETDLLIEKRGDEDEHTDAPPMRHVAIKLVFIAFMNLLMIIFCFAYFPLDWNSWLGSNPNNREGAYQTLTNSWLCLANNQWPECDAARKWFFIFSGVFSSMTLGTVILNRFSPPLCAMLMQIGTPLCALLLIDYPSWNPPGSAPANTDKAQTQGSVALIVIGAVVLGLWEMVTRMRKAEKAEEEAASGAIQNNYNYA